MLLNLDSFKSSLYMIVNPQVFQNLKVTEIARLDKLTFWKTSAPALYHYHNYSVYEDVILDKQAYVSFGYRNQIESGCI